MMFEVVRGNRLEAHKPGTSTSFLSHTMTVPDHSCNVDLAATLFRLPLAPKTTCPVDSCVSSRVETDICYHSK